jgi:arginine decarboxylase
MIPKYFFLTKGVGNHKKRLLSFEFALRNAGIQHLNLVNVSSIIPPGCKRISKEQGLKMLKAGEITFAVLVKNSTNKPKETIAAAIGVAIPSGKNSYGYLSEHHSIGRMAETAGEYAEESAATMIATNKGIQFDPKFPLDERKRLLRAKELIDITNITQYARGGKDGVWTTVIAAAVFVV